MAITITNGVATASTTNATTYAAGSITPAAGDLIVVFVHVSGNVAVPTMTDTQNLGFVYIGSAFDASSVNTVHAFVSSQAAAASAEVVTFSCVGTTATGAIVNPIRVAGMTKFGAFAVRQFVASTNNAASTPTITFGSTPLTTNPLFGAIGNGTNPATMTPPTSWTEMADVGYATPTTGMETAAITGGITATAVTWGSASASAWGGIILELDASNTGWTVIQSKSGIKSASAGTTGTVTLATTTNGSALVSGVTNDNGSTGNTISIVATGTSWTKKEDVVSGGIANESIWYSYNTTSAATPTATLTFSTSTIGGWWIREYVYYNAGVVVSITADPYDKSKSATGSSTTPSTGNTATLTGSNDLAVAIAGTLDSTNIYSAGSGWSGPATVKAGATLDMGIEDRVLSSNAAIAGTFTITSLDSWGAAVITLQRPATSAPTMTGISSITGISTVQF